MRMAAERTGGIYIDGSREDAASILSNHLLSVSHETSPGNSRPEPKERRTLFIILALIAYGVSKLIPRLLVKKLIPLASIVFIVSMLASCSDGKLLLVEANYLHSRGRYDEAIIPYLRALNFESAAPYAEYGLGLTFHSLDEGRAALRRFETSQRLLERLPPAEHRELRFRINYNSGIIFFEEGDYSAAAAAFRDALRSDPRRVDAKRNLELSLMSIERQTADDNQGEGRQKNETREILFEFLRDQEQQIWRGREWAPEEPFTGLDY
jgi:Ca-activated chloride channel family protein